MKPFECSENGVDRLGLFRIGKYPVFRRNVLRPVVILLEALRDCRHVPTGSEYAALVDTHIPPVCLIIEVVLNIFLQRKLVIKSRRSDVLLHMDMHITMTSKTIGAANI